jgi:diacylglycerol kinase (ATP)
MPPPRALLVGNSSSRQGETGLAEAAELLRGQGLEVIEASPEHPQEVPEVIRHYGHRVDRIIIGGGDGTLNAAAEALLECGVPLGVLPLGTANDLARTLEIPTTLAAACTVITSGRLRRIDLGCVNGKLFFNVANIGLGVQVTRSLSRQIKARWGALAYARTLLQAVRSQSSFHAEVRCDGRVRRLRSIQIAVGNGRYYGGGMTMTPQSAIDDHWLDVYSIEPQGLLRLLRLAPRVLRRGLDPGAPGVHLLRGAQVEVRTHRPMHVTTDGELTTHTPARFHVVPNALQVYAPTPGAEPRADQEITARVAR